MTDLPPPFTPACCDLRGMPYMPIDMVRLFDSDFYALSNGAEFKAGFTLWGKAFLQVPAGSLPDDDRILAHLSGAGMDWPKIRDMALHGWTKCSDGRLYHRTVAEKVVEAWQARMAARARTEAARNAKKSNRYAANGSQPPPAESVTTPVTESVTEHVTESVTEHSKGKLREAKVREEEERQPLATLAPSTGVEAVTDFETFWRLYPRKVSKGHARRAFEAAAKRVAAGVIIAALDHAVFNPDPRYIPHPATWLNGERWRDEVDSFDPVLRAAGLSPSDFSGRLQ